MRKIVQQRKNHNEITVVSEYCSCTTTRYYSARANSVGRKINQTAQKHLNCSTTRADTWWYVAQLGKNVGNRVSAEMK